MINRPWPPTFILKKHLRAKYVKFRVCEKRGLIVTVPKRFKISDLSAIIDSQREWILKKLPPNFYEPVTLPAQIMLPYLNQSWHIRYQSIARAPKLIELPQHQLCILGNLNETEKIRSLFIKWLKKLAAEYFAIAMQRLSVTTQLPFHKLAIRHQRSLWGSCNSAKEISLNVKLIFLDRSLAEHVMLHELIHTKYLNHSKKFWHLLASYDKKCSEHKRILRRAQKNIPTWLDHALLIVQPTI